ncbi:MAG: hypothetical protein RLZZ292_2533, partial [Bacteroidota bacterium]
MRIQQIQLENIGVFENQTVVFPPCPTQDKAEIHIFTGNNGVGKSTLLKSLVSVFDNLTHCGGKDSAKIFNYLRKDTNAKIDCCKGTVLLEDNNTINFYGCDGGENHVHSDTTSKEILFYKELQNQQERPKTKLKFACFAYSGYRFVDIDANHNSENDYNRNPLYEALDFYKKFNSGYIIRNWIKSSVLKRSYAQSQNLDTKLKNYQQTVEKLEEAISEIIGFSVKFKMDKNLRQAVIHYNEQEHDLEVLPDGLKSIISWLADLCMRLEDLDWLDDTPVFDRNIILFLDEIENHLHIKWQRKVLPVVQKLLPNAQIFVTTHSPFIINSVDDAFVYKLSINPATNFSVVAPAKATNSGNSYITEL